MGRKNKFAKGEKEKGATIGNVINTMIVRGIGKSRKKRKETQPVGWSGRGTYFTRI